MDGQNIMSMTLQELISYLKEKYDSDDLVEMLDITTDELLDRFEDKLESHRHKFYEIEQEADERMKLPWED